MRYAPLSCYNITRLRLPPAQFVHAANHKTRFPFFPALPRLGLTVFLLAARRPCIGSRCIFVAYGGLGHGVVVSVMTTPVIEFDQVSLGWGGRVAVRDVSGSFKQGSLTAIVGPNGAGKSTLVKGITGLISPLRGHIRLGSGARIACLPQLSELDRSFPVTVYDLVAMGSWPRVGSWRRFGRSEHDSIQQALNTVGLADFAQRIIGTLSGGQLQRALFARLMLHDADTLVLDEPFAAVDRATTDDLVAIISNWHREGRTVIAVLHDLELVRSHFPQALLLAGQAVAWGPTPDVLTTENMHLARHLCAGDFL